MARTPKHELSFCTKKQLFDILELLWKKLEKIQVRWGGSQTKKPCTETKVRKTTSNRAMEGNNSNHSDNINMNLNSSTAILV